jgi:hypothetical protein
MSTSSTDLERTFHFIVDNKDEGRSDSSEVVHHGAWFLMREKKFLMRKNVWKSDKLN